MKKNNSSKNIIIAIIVMVVVVFLVSFTVAKRNESKNSSVVGSTVDDSVGLIDRAISFPVRAIQGGISSIGNLFTTYNENDRLKKRIDQYEVLESENESYKKENAELKKQLGMDDSLTNYDKLTANVISRSPDTWQNILVIDRGANVGIETGMPVIGEGGLVGRVIVANAMSSKVELLTSTNQNANHFPVMITPEGKEAAYGVLSDYSEKDNVFVVKQLTSLSGIKEGDKVSTSGLGGGSPRGLPVGEVVKIKESGFGLDKEVYIKANSSMYDMSVVTVIKRLVESDENE
ncbi:rod shape-determining protein MreC [Vagococcus sp. PNs007]|uniref:Cell shape-determining protein MreC n=1 Tax=Vagococcus proximus TaxID=2991417 RepID=A0ABT5X150_9ENTE|nr:rod shape-determining protein MreC [Vagococcus proximus]